ncbi:MAG TPA: TonB-dependent receptor, partial [Chitinophagaceae bacterium]|nr:TonB-dependent receptor [Chitinophagaceae bacterium]
NGVIIITTKSGKAGKTKLELNVYTGAGKIPERLNLLTTPEYLAMRNEAFANDKVAKSSTNAPDIFVWDTSRYTDWQKLLVGGTDHIVNAQLNISGGNANTQFLVGGGYYRESTVFPGEFSSQKGSTIFNVVNTSENKRFKIIFGASFQLNINSLPVSDLFTTAIQLPPDTPPIYDSAGKLNWAGGFSNPYSALQVKYSGRSENLFSNAVLSYAVIKGLSIKSGFGYNQTSLTENTTTPLSSLSPSSTSTSGSSIFANNKINTWIIEPQLEYQRTIGKGNLTILAGGTLQNNTRQGQSLSATGFASDDLLGSIKAATKITVNSNLFTQYKYAAVFGRINYNFKEKYLINLTGRRDGSSRFGPGKQFANFGAAGSAWIFSKENFVMKYLKFLSFGKLRASYGTAGNDQIADYGYVDLYNSTSYSYGGGAGLSPVNLFNPDFSWEINKKLEVGIELGFLNDKIFLNVEYYKNRSSSQLVGLPLAPTAGFITLQANLPAKVQNSGLEFEFSATLLKTKKLHWTGSVNLSVPYNKLIAYPDIASSPYAQAYIVGKSLFLAKRIHYTGVDPTTGIYLFEDVNGNGSVNDLVDRQALKKLTQVYFGGMKNNIRYKQWEFDMLVQFVRQTGNSYMAIFNAPGYRSNQPDIVWGRWQRPGDVTNIQKFTQGGSSSTAYSNSIASDLLINTDASF